MGIAKLYAIIDRETLDRQGMSVAEFARELREGGVRLVQYRDKVSGPQEVLRAAAEITAAFEGVDATLILNDRADLASLAGWGVHVGQGDLSVEDAQRVVGSAAVVGVSTHTVEQVGVADKAFGDTEMGGSGRAQRDTPPFRKKRERIGHPELCSSYVAVGPVFGTVTKKDAEPVVGLGGVRSARALTQKPLVAIGGITLANCRSVIEAGADSVAVISGLFVEDRSVRDVVRDFLAVLG